MPSPSPLPAATVVARLSTDGAAARHIGDVLSESFDPEEVAASAFEHASLASANALAVDGRLGFAHGRCAIVAREDDDRVVT